MAPKTLLDLSDEILLRIIGQIQARKFRADWCFPRPSCLLSIASTCWRLRGLAAPLTFNALSCRPSKKDRAHVDSFIRVVRSSMTMRIYARHLTLNLNGPFSGATSPSNTVTEAQIKLLLDSLLGWVSSLEMCISTTYATHLESMLNNYRGWQHPLFPYITKLFTTCEGIGLVQNCPNLEDFTLLFWKDGAPFISLDPKHVGLGMLCKVIEDFTQDFANTGHNVTRLTLKRTDIWEEAIQEIMNRTSIKHLDLSDTSPDFTRLGLKRSLRNWGEPSDLQSIVLPPVHHFNWHVSESYTHDLRAGEVIARSLFNGNEDLNQVSFKYLKGFNVITAERDADDEVVSVKWTQLDPAFNSLRAVPHQALSTEEWLETREGKIFARQLAHDIDEDEEAEMQG